MADTATYRTIWRWHLYAGLFVLPFVLILSMTGVIYLFKPQIDRWEEHEYRGLSPSGAVSADRQLQAALNAYPGGSFHHYRLPGHPGDAALVQLGLPGGAVVEVFVSPQGEVLAALDPANRISAVVANIHGSLLMGKWGDRLVELAASWTIVMILTGLYLWWPRPFAAAGTLYPRLSLKGRPLLKDLHRVTGLWIAGFILIMLASGLPWAETWGGAFKWAQTGLGLIEGTHEWKIGAEANSVASAAPDHQGHDHRIPTADTPKHQTTAEGGGGPILSAFANLAKNEAMEFPVLVLPPHAPQRFGPPTGNVWTVKSETQNRPLTRSVMFDPASGAVVNRIEFRDQHPIDRIVNYGIAWHEGQLFGLANQIMGLVIALALIAISVLGVAMWLKRRPVGTLGTPVGSLPGRKPLFLLLIAVLGTALPLFGASLLILLLLEFLHGRLRPAINGWGRNQEKPPRWRSKNPSSQD